ncbi:MAG: TetR/AcrR family transcriptional regulator [Planctomycetes bacterium]|nr:TetR/AcrR family transcriptional regulator [Planctomycetota bacterium]
MGKGNETKAAILEHAMALASRVGLGGLSIGRLAEELEMSKSGLFAHFRSKEALQVQVLDAAADRFVNVVVAPALKKARGEPRIRALLENLLAWDRARTLPGGCIFVAAAVELDDQPGPARDRLVQLQRDRQETFATAARIAKEEGQFRADLDPLQFAHDLYGIVLGYHHAARLLRDPQAETRARNAFETLLQHARSRR